MEAELKSLRIDRSAKRPPESNRALRYVLWAAAALVILAAIAFAYEKLNAPVQVRTVQVRPPSTGAGGDEEIILTATGYIVAHHKIEVASKVAGRVAEISVEKGDKVKAGQILVRLENDEYRAQLEQQEGQLANLRARLAELKNGSRPQEISRARADRDEAQADLTDAKSSLDRTRQLVDEGVMAKQTLDDAVAKYNADQQKVASLEQTLNLAQIGTRSEEIAQVEGQIQEAKGGVDYARTQLENTVIRAPVNGTILDRNVERGEFVTNGFVGDKGAKGYLVTMADLNDLQVELDINQSDFPKLGPQQKGMVTTDAYPDRKYQGFVEEVSPEADRSKATVQVKVKILKPDSYLRPDMNATVSFYNASTGSPGGTKSLVIVPSNSLHDGAVFVVVDSHAVKRAVTTDGSSADGVLISKGLIGGEQLVINPPAGLKDGQRVVGQ